MFYKEIFFTFVFLLVFVPFSTAIAQSEAEQDAQSFQFSDAYVERIATSLKLPKDSRHIKRLFNPKSYQIKEQHFPTKILKHIKGHGKERFATEAEAKEAQLAFAKKENALENKHKKEMLAKSQDYIFSIQGKSSVPSYDETFDEEEGSASENSDEELLNLAATLDTRLPICKENKTEENDISYLKIHPSDDLMYDFIILNPKTPLPSDIKKAFGNRVVIHFYSNTKGDAASQALSKYNVRCLPARLRATEKVVFIDQGLNALKNYDKDFYGKGILDSRIVKAMNIR